MITLTGGNVQNLAGVAVPNGYIELTLTGDASIIASPGFVVAGVPIRFNFDATANLQGTCKIWSNAELQPQTQYVVEFFNSNGARLSNTPTYWQFIQASGSSVDIGTIVPAPGPIAQAGVAFSSVAANLFLAGPTSGGAAFPTFRNIVGADLPSPIPTLAIQQIALNSFNILDALGVSHFSISNSSPYVNTSVQGNGAGSVFLGSAALCSVADTTGIVTTPGVTTPLITQKAATAFVIKDNQGGTRFSIPSGGITQSTLNNTLITGSSTYGGTTPSRQIFTASGTFTVPANVNNAKAFVTGGGGAGGGATTTANASGTGGGGGGTAIKWLTGLTPGLTITVTIGSGGTGVANAPGNGGTNSSISSGTQTIATVTGNGGAGGAATGNIVGDIRGASAGGDLNWHGGQPDGIRLTNSGGVGGSSYWTPSGGAGGFVGAGNAADANSGGGGGGAGGAAGGAVAGGNGGSGIVVFEWMV